MKCCGNCKWSMSYEDGEMMCNDDNELNIPSIGDCCLGIDHEGKYICENYSSNIDTLTWIIYDSLKDGILYEIITKYNDEFIYSITINKKNIKNDNVETIVIPINLMLDNNSLRKILNALSRMIREENIFALKNDVKTLRRILV